VSGVTSGAGAPAPEDAHRALEEIVRVAGRDVLATLARWTGNFALAEDAVQDASLRALQTWPRDGIPDSPVAWLRTTSRRRAVDLIRREAARGPKEALATGPLPEVALPDEDPEPEVVDDDLLRLVFTCCHPSLAPETRVALALRTLCGLSTQEVARALVVSEPTMAKRLTRAKEKIRRAGIPYRVPAAADLPERWDTVLATTYLLFNEGYAATAGPDPIRGELCDEAIRLARLVVRLMPDEAEASGLLGLLLATDARRAARYDGDRMVPLDEHDRSRYDRGQLREAQGLVESALRREPGPYGVQAAIAALHTEATSSEDTDWAQIVELYDLLERMAGTPVVALNRAAAVSFAAGPADALPLLDELAPDLRDFGPYHAARADVLRRLGRGDEACEAYQAALATTTNPGESEFLRARLTALRR